MGGLKFCERLFSSFFFFLLPLPVSSSSFLPTEIPLLDDKSITCLFSVSFVFVFLANKVKWLVDQGQHGGLHLLELEELPRPDRATGQISGEDLRSVPEAVGLCDLSDCKSGQGLFYCTRGVTGVHLGLITRLVVK